MFIFWTRVLYVYGLGYTGLDRAWIWAAAGQEKKLRGQKYPSEIRLGGSTGAGLTQTKRNCGNLVSPPRETQGGTLAALLPPPPLLPAVNSATGQSLVSCPAAERLSPLSIVVGAGQPDRAGRRTSVGPGGAVAGFLGYVVRGTAAAAACSQHGDGCVVGKVDGRGRCRV